MRIVRARPQPGLWQEFERKLFLEGPDLTGVPGLRMSWILHDLDDQEAGFVVALWDSEASALAFEQDVELNELLGKPLPGEFEFHLCEIRSVRFYGPDSASGSQPATALPPPG